MMNHRLAAPFVVTVGLMTSGCTTTNPQPANTIVDVPDGGEGPTAGGGEEPGTDDDGNDGTGADEDDAATDPALAASERIEKRDDGTCWKYADVECPPSPATCNPPPPMKVDCPADMQ